VIVETSIGNLSFTVEAMEGDLSNAEVVNSKIEPFIPEGMTVELSIAVLLRASSPKPIKKLSFSCSWIDYNETGYGCSGEYLDAWEWESNNQLVMIGTEDAEMLGGRLKIREMTLENSPISQNNNIVNIEVNKYPENKELTLHFIIAQNRLPETVDASCWYAVDVPHKRVISECK
jgi:hypothetical protein